MAYPSEGIDMPKTTHLNCTGAKTSCNGCHADAMRERRKRYIARTDEEVAADRRAFRPGSSKKCGRCHVVKDFSEFSPTKYNLDGLAYRCNPCAVESGTLRKSLKRALPYWRAEGMSPHECTYCGTPVNFRGANPSAPTMQVDHIVARSKGGSNKPENLAPSCPTCNLVKKDRSLADFLTVPAKR